MSQQIDINLTNLERLIKPEMSSDEFNSLNEQLAEIENVFVEKLGYRLDYLMDLKLDFINKNNNLITYGDQYCFFKGYISYLKNLNYRINL